MDLLKQNVLPLILGAFGLLFIFIGIYQLVGYKNEDSQLLFEAGESNIGNREIIIDVEGAVINPGVYTLVADSRMVDALAEAGGLSEEADRLWVEKNINLAGRLTDGLKIYVPRQGEQVSIQQSDLVNINTASEAELDTLEGVGPATASKIIEGRPYTDVSELVSKKVMSQNAFNSVKDKITAF